MLAKGLDNMRLAILEHNEEEIALLVQNHDMITGLSHDLRTPLTKLMIYSEIIRCRRYKNEEQLNKYLDTICENVEQMKEISEHLLQYSLMQKETSATHMQPSFIQSSIEGILIEMVDYLCHHGFVVDCEINWQPVRIEVVDFYLRRIFDNITSNIEKYGDSSKPVYIRHIYTEKYAGFSFENTVAGHSSDVESTNVGLVNLNSMLSHMNGKCVVDTANGRYELGVMFRVFE